MTDGFGDVRGCGPRRWDTLADLLTRAQLVPGRTDVDVIAEAEALFVAETDASWRARWVYARAAAELAGDDLAGARESVDRLLVEATTSTTPALVALAHGMHSWLASVQGRVDDAVAHVGHAVAVADASDRSTGVEDWSSALLVIGNAFTSLELLEHAERWLTQHGRLDPTKVSAVDAYAAQWNLCAVTGRLALRALRRPPFEPDAALFDRIAHHGRVVDELAAESGFEEPGWGALWIAVAEAFVGDPKRALEQLAVLHDLRDDVSLQRSAGDLWRVGRLRALLRSGQAGSALAWDEEIGGSDGAEPPGVVHVEELAWERLMAATASSGTARAMVYQFAAATQTRWVLGTALATDQLVARVAELAGARDRERLADEAARDPLTDVLNRRGLMPVLSRAAGAPAPTSYGLFVVDVDAFKEVNDAGSHATGDEVLRQVAAVLTASARSQDAVARLGGDEFVLIAMVGVRAAERLGQRLARAVREISRDAYAVTVSVGAAVRTAPVDVDEWLDAADHAMFAAKRMARGSVRVTELAPPTGEVTH